MSETDKEGFDPEAFGERLEQEMLAQGWDVQTLRDKLTRETNGTRGTSYGAVWSYVNGQAPARGPRQKVVEGLAELFSVRPEYLLHGGPRTEAEAALQEEGETPLYKELRARIPELEDLDLAVQAALMTYMNRWVKAHRRVEYEVSVEDALEHTVSAWHYMHEPLRAWGRRIGKDLPLHRTGASDYLMAMLHALNMSLQVAAPPGVSYEDIQEWPDLEPPQEEES